ncbi:hypothetical protein B0H11DRAFT_1928910 [Mycena galericulata]|nr:hypothetical protein B0H11DRAFT_1928910 [Mycena galericulata]
MCLIGKMQEGVYLDDCEGVHPNVIERYYGTHGPEIHREAGQTGAGQLDDEEISPPLSDSGDIPNEETDSDPEEQMEDGASSSSAGDNSGEQSEEEPEEDIDSEDSEEENNLAQHVEEAHAENFHHEAVPVPKHANPFDDKDSMQLFYDSLQAAIRDELVQSG